MNWIEPETFAGTALSVVLAAAVRSVLILAVASLVVLCLCRASAAMRHWIWFLAIASLLLLPVLSAVLPGWHILPLWMGDARVPAAPEKSQSLIPTVNLGGSREVLFAPDAGVRNPTTPAPTPTASTALDSSNKARRFDLWSWGLFLWLTGTLLALAPTILGTLSLWRLGRRSPRIVEGAWLELLRSLSASLRFKRPVALLKSVCRRMPMTWGFLRPKLLLPDDARDWPAERRRVVLLHELAHMKRGDYLTNLLAQVACALYWFNPLVWMAARRMVAEREGACDDIVLNQGAKPADYAEQVLQVASRFRSNPWASYSGVAMARPSKLERRLRAILDRQRDRRAATRLAVLIAVIVFTAVVFPLAMLRAKAQDPAKQRSSIFFSLAELGRANVGQKMHSVQNGRNLFLRLADLGRARARAARNAAGDGSLPSFAPIVERVLKAQDECLLDLDTGQTQGPVIIGGETDLSPTMDLSIPYTQVEGEFVSERVVALAHLGVWPATSADWDIVPEEFIKRLPREERSVVGGAAKATELANPQDELPRTYFFRTPKGNEGVLQVVAFTHNPGGVKIRYKLAQAGSPPRAEQAFGDPLLQAQKKSASSPLREELSNEPDADKPQSARAAVQTQLAEAPGARATDLSTDILHQKIASHQDGKLAACSSCHVVTDRLLLTWLAAQMPRQRHFVRLVVGQDSLTFEGQPTTWEELPDLLARIPNRAWTVLELAVASDTLTIGQLHGAQDRAGKLRQQFGFEYLSYVGVQPLGSKGSATTVLPRPHAATDETKELENQPTELARWRLRQAEGELERISKLHVDQLVSDHELNQAKLVLELLRRGTARAHLTPVAKAPEDWRSPRPGGTPPPPRQSRSVLDCGSPLPLFSIAR